MHRICDLQLPVEEIDIFFDYIANDQRMQRVSGPDFDKRSRGVVIVEIWLLNGKNWQAYFNGALAILLWQTIGRCSRIIVNNAVPLIGGQNRLRRIEV